MQLDATDHRPRFTAGRAVRVLAVIIVASAAILVGLMVSISTVALIGPLAIVPFVMLVLALAALGAMAWKTYVAERAPLERFAARVVEENRRMVGTGGAALTAGSYTTLEFVNGTRREFPTIESLTGRITSDDMGIAFLHGGMLVEFGRVPV